MRKSTVTVISIASALSTIALVYVGTVFVIGRLFLFNKEEDNSGYLSSNI